MWIAAAVSGVSLGISHGRLDGLSPVCPCFRRTIQFQRSRPGRVKLIESHPQVYVNVSFCRHSQIHVSNYYRLMLRAIRCVKPFVVHVAANTRAIRIHVLFARHSKVRAAHTITCSGFKKSGLQPDAGWIKDRGEAGLAVAHWDFGIHVQYLSLRVTMSHCTIDESALVHVIDNDWYSLW